MPKIHTINRNGVFKRAYAKGRYFVSPNLITYVIRGRGEDKKIGITTSKKTGNAVLRNRSRRIIKEAYRQVYFNVKSGFNVVFVARKKTHSVKMNDVKRDMIYHLKKAGIWI